MYKASIKWRRIHYANYQIQNCWYKKTYCYVIISFHKVGSIRDCSGIKAIQFNLVARSEVTNEFVSCFSLPSQLPDTNRNTLSSFSSWVHLKEIFLVLLDLPIVRSLYHEDGVSTLDLTTRYQSSPEIVNTG